MNSTLALDYKATRLSAWKKFLERPGFLVGIGVAVYFFNLIWNAASNYFIVYIFSDSQTLLNLEQAASEIMLGDTISAVISSLMPALLIGAVFGIIASIINFGYIYTVVKHAAGLKSSFLDLFQGFRDIRHWWTYTLANILIGFLFLIPFAIIAALFVFIAMSPMEDSLQIVLFVILGALSLYFIVRHFIVAYAFMVYAVLVDKKGAVESIRYSRMITNDNAIPTLRVILQVFIWIIIGLLALFIGLAVAIPFATIMSYMYYKQFSDSFEGIVGEDDASQGEAVAVEA